MICGIDPGLTGAYAIVNKKTQGNTVVKVRDIPITLKNKKLRINANKLLCNLKSDFESLGDISHVIVEKQQPMPKQGVSSCFSIGESFGIVQGVLAALNSTTEIVTPQAWKKKLNIPKGEDRALRKENAKQKFYELFDEYEPAQSSRVKDIDRMEACLIALYEKE